MFFVVLHFYLSYMCECKADFTYNNNNDNSRYVSLKLCIKLV